MKKFSDYTTPNSHEEKPKQVLSLTEQAWANAKQKINEQADAFKPHEPIVEIIQEETQEEETVEVLPELAPIVEEVIEEEVNPEDVQRLIESLTGPQGERGEKGDKGDKGDTGEQGPKGDRGFDGARGPEGQQGIKGDKGDRGDNGADGKNGKDGVQGPKGDKGDVGPKGDKGDVGPQGIQGPQGEKGDKGDVGPTGEKGSTGAKGDKGDKGDRGDKGDKGDVGEQGPKGDKGDQGPIGPIGREGPRGADGKTPDIKKFAEKFEKLSQDINKRIDKTVQGINLTGGGGSGSYWLNDLGDTDYQGIKNATDGQVLTFDETLGKWTAADATGVGGGTVDSVARTRATNAWNQANTGTLLAQAAYDYANTIVSDTQIDQTARNIANLAYDAANTSVTSGQANVGSGLITVTNNYQANVGSGIITVTSAYQANVGAARIATFNHANSAYAQANAGVAQASSALLRAIDANTLATTANTTAQGAFNKANSSTLLAQAAYDFANTIVSDTQIDPYARNVANSAYDAANSAVTTGQANVGAGLITVTNAYQANVGSAIVQGQANVGAGLLAYQTTSQANVGSAIAQGQANTGTGLITVTSAYQANIGAGLLTKLDLAGGSLTNRLNVTYTPASTINAAITITAANTKGGTGYADSLQLINSSGGATNPNKYIRLTSAGELQIINSEYTAMLFGLTDSGDLTIAGNVLSSGIQSGYNGNRPAFRVYGGGTTNINATNTLTNSNFVVEYNQGNYLNPTTGIFTAPVAGLYQVNLIARYAGSGSTSAIQVQRVSGGITQTQVYLEWAGNSTAFHYGGSSVVKMAVGDTLKTVVTAGTVTFDANDCWSVAYLG